MGFEDAIRRDRAIVLHHFPNIILKKTFQLLSLGFHECQAVCQAHVSFTELVFSCFGLGAGCFGVCFVCGL